MKTNIIFLISMVYHVFGKESKAIISRLTHSQNSGSVPNYIDNSSVCPKLYFSTNRVVQNCSSLNLAANWNVENIDSHFVTELILSNNNFRENLPKNEINQYDSLTLLDLASNFINELTTDLQRIDCKINNFKTFILNHNRFTQIPLLNSNCMNTIEKLFINNNKLLVNFDNKNTFTNPIDTQSVTKTMEKLKYLDVSHCNIEELNKENYSILKYFPKLVYLNLIGNRIKYIYQNPFQQLRYLHYLSFEQNNIFCDINIIWVKDYLSSKNTRICCDNEPVLPIDPQIIDILPNGGIGSKDYAPTCFSPLTLKNESILTFPQHLFLISIKLTTTLEITELSVNSGDSVSLDCSLFSQPSSDLWWSFNDRILSKTVTPNSPYEFNENFDATNTANLLNKTSVLIIKKSTQNLAGKYSCNAFYSNYEPNQYLSINTLSFQLNVGKDPVPLAVVGPLTAGEIAGIVIGSILGFLLLCLFIFLCVYCCCFNGTNLCCFPCFCCFPCLEGSRKQKKISKYSSSTVNSISSDLRYSSTKQNHITETEESQSGFKDLNHIKPNYVANTVSKSTGGSYRKDNENFHESSITWKILPNKNLTDTDLNTLHNGNINIIQTTDSYDNSRTLINQFSQQDLIDINPSLETEFINDASNGKYSLTAINKNHHKPQIYSINNPIDYGSTYNTNEGFLNDNSDLNQVRFSTDIIINKNEEYDSFDPNNIQQYTNNIGVYSSSAGNNFSSFSKEVTNSEIIRNKQYINSNNFNNNYIHEVNNTSFVKYDSDV